MLSEVFAIIIYVNKYAMTTCNKASCQTWYLLYRYPTVYFLNLSYWIISYPTLPYYIQHHTLSYPTPYRACSLPYYKHTLICPAMLCPVLICPALPYAALPCPAPHTNPNPTMLSFVAII